MVKFGVGARICIVISAAYLLLYTYTFESNLDYWKKNERCTTLGHFPPPPIGFEIVKDERINYPVTKGAQRYEVCFRKPPFLSSEPIPDGCSILLADQDRVTAVFLDGPRNMSTNDIQNAAYRLGLSDELMKIMATPGPSFATDELRLEYESCAKNRFNTDFKKPEFDIYSILIALAWIWGLYGIARFLRGK